MKIRGTTSVSVPRDEVWETLTDPNRITGLLPDGEIISADGKTWRTRLAPETALGKSPFDFTFVRTEERTGEYMEITGHGYGSQHVVDLTASLELRDEGSGTMIEWEADVRLGGVLASLGQRSLPYVVHRQVEQTLRGLEQSRSGAPA